MHEPAIECGDPLVARLLVFVAARVEEDQVAGDGASAAEPCRSEMLDVVEQVLLDMAREDCRAGRACTLPAPCLRALGEYASTHRSHPDFDPAWLVFRLLP